MVRKKIAAALLASVLVLGSVAVPSAQASAAAKKTYPICSVYGCNKTSNHKHNGKTYCGHYTNDGHSHHTSGSSGHHSSGRHH